MVTVTDGADVPVIRFAGHHCVCNAVRLEIEPIVKPRTGSTDDEDGTVLRIEYGCDHRSRTIFIRSRVVVAFDVGRCTYRVNIDRASRESVDDSIEICTQS